MGGSPWRRLRVAIEGSVCFRLSLQFCIRLLKFVTRKRVLSLVKNEIKRYTDVRDDTAVCESIHKKG